MHTASLRCTAGITVQPVREDVATREQSKPAEKKIQQAPVSTAQNSQK